MRAVVDDRPLLELNGVRPDRVSLVSWMIGVSLSALAGILITPFQGGSLSSTLLTLLVINAFAAAMFGRLRNLPMTFVGAVVLGFATRMAFPRPTGLMPKNFDWGGNLRLAVPMHPAVRRAPGAPAGPAPRRGRVPHPRALQPPVDARRLRRRGRARRDRVHALADHGAVAVDHVERRARGRDHPAVARIARRLRGRGEPGDDGPGGHRRHRVLPPCRAQRDEPGRPRRVRDRDRRDRTRRRRDRVAGAATARAVSRARDGRVLAGRRADAVQGVHRVAAHLSGDADPAGRVRPRRGVSGIYRRITSGARPSRRSARARSSRSPRRTRGCRRSSGAHCSRTAVCRCRGRISSGSTSIRRRTSSCCSSSCSRFSASGLDRDATERVRAPADRDEEQPGRVRHARSERRAAEAVGVHDLGRDRGLWAGACSRRRSVRSPPTGSACSSR